MIKQRLRVAILLSVVLMTIAGCGGTAEPQEEATPTPIPTPVVPSRPTYEVKRGEVVSSAQFVGRIAPVVEEELFFRIDGRVENVYVDRNQQVEEGEVLAELEVTDLKNQLTQAETDLEAMRQDYDLRVTEAEATLKSAEWRLAQAHINDPAPQVEIAKVSLEQAEATLAEAQHEQQAQQAHWNYRVAKARYEQALQAQESHRYDLQLLAQDVELARRHLEEVKAGLDVTQAELRVKRLKDLIADAQITAPFDGTVLFVEIEEGDDAVGYREIMTIAELDELEISADLSEDLLQNLVEGMEVTVKPVTGADETFDGTIRRLPYPYGSASSAESDDETTRVSLNTDLEFEGFEIGKMMEVTVLLERKENVLWLPPQAIRTFEGRNFVVVQEGEGQRRVDVTIGIEGRDRVEIEDGLSEGQVVIGQ